ncbi:sodium:solute symporter family protein [candidate division KSB1 bacterium]|nr:sodium:solute symporter family protein [candidate division KSB1 bacterium]
MAASDYIILLLYLVVLLYLGFVRSRHADRNLEEYVLAGRRLSLPAFVATLVTTWYGGILGVGEFSYKHGLSNWLVFGVPYYLYAIIFAFFLAGRARRQALLTIPEQLERSYGKAAGIVGALFVFMLSTPAPYVLMLGVLCEILFGWQLWVGVLVGTLFSMIYAFRGGFAAVVRTEIFQFILMFAGFALLLGFAVIKFGGLEFLQRNLPAAHLTWHGGNPPLYILVWYFIAMSTLVDPAFYQRCFAARDEKTARNGILVSVLCWALFDFMTTTTGLYARALLPNLSNAIASYPQLALQLLPAAARGLFYVAMFATIMSTVDGFSFTAAITLGKDVLAKLLKRDLDADLTRLTRSGLVITFVLAIAIALWARSVVEIWYQLGTIATPALLLPLASSFSEKWRMRPRMALMSMLVSAGLTGTWLLNQSEGRYWWGIEPIYPGLVCAVLFFVWGRRKSGKEETLH